MTLGTLNEMIYIEYISMRSILNEMIYIEYISMRSILNEMTHRGY
jgi:hypothetical protein